VPFGAPSFEIPDIPDDITIVGDEELMLLFSQFVQWQNYAATDFAQAEVTEARAEAKVRYVEAQSMVGNWSNAKDKVTLSRAQMALEPDVIEVRNEAMVAYARRKLVAVVYENCERCAQLISRELSRRIGGGTSPTQRRQQRWNP
jgi:hypothetical protein